MRLLSNIKLDDKMTKRHFLDTFRWTKQLLGISYLSNNYSWLLCPSNELSLFESHRF